ncbi:glycosyltransferase family 9 protein [bacterium]
MKKKFLVIQLRKLGDVLLTTPVIDVLKEHYPDAEIDFLVEAAYAEVLSGNPKIKNIYTLDKKSLKNQFKTLMKIRKRRYTYTLDFFCNPRSAWWSYFSGAEYKVGFNYPGRKWLYDICIERSQESKYNVDFKMDLLKFLDIETKHRKLSLFVPEKTTQKMEKNLSKHGYEIGDNVVGIVVPNNRDVSKIKNWRMEGYAELIEKILHELNYKVVILWGPGEEDIANRLWRLVPHKNVFLPKATKIKELAALISHCNAVVTGCVGPKHIAIAMDVPTVTIFGPTQVISWNPPDDKSPVVTADKIDCLGCDKIYCEKMDCMRLVTVDMVFNTLKGLLNQYAN